MVSVKRVEKRDSALLRATLAIPTYARCVEELATNSAEAKATTIAIRLQIDSGAIEIVDDGRGIDRARLKTIFDVENKMTALRTLSEALDVKSRHVAASTSHAVAFRRGAALPRRRVDAMRTPGTIVFISNLFRGVPVREKRLRTHAQQVRKNLYHVLVAFALVRHHVTINVTDFVGDVIFRSAGARSVQLAFAQLVCQEGARKLRKLDYREGEYVLEGWVSSAWHASRSRQYLYVNSRCLVNSKLHGIIERLLLTEMEENGFPVFVLNLHCPASDCDVLTNPMKTLLEFKSWSFVNRFLSRSFDEFLGRDEPKEETTDLLASSSSSCPSSFALHIEPFFILRSKVTRRDSTSVQRKRSHYSDFMDIANCSQNPCKISHCIRGYQESDYQYRRALWKPEPETNDTGEISSWKRPSLPRVASESLGAIETQIRFTKEDLHNVSVLGQVENQFIVCLMKGNRDRKDSLVLIDQHAAHERVRLEQLEKELYGCGGSHYEGVSPDAVLPLDRPLAYKFSGLTKRALLYHSSGFERWGIHYQFTRTTPTNVDIQVNKIPRVFEDESIGNDVRTTIKGLIIEVAERILASTHATQTTLSTLQNSLNSKACHGAIRFGDPLTVSQCRSLMRQLSLCHLPFQCAHGRPSIQPLINV